MPRETVYPISTTVERQTRLAAADMGHSKLPEYVELMIGALGEYEHGSADVEDVFADITAADVIHSKVMLEMYAAVVSDLSLVILAQT